MPLYLPPSVGGGVPFNIKDYGAVGDNSHDDTAAVQAAVTAAIAAGGRLRVPGSADSYKLTSTINIVPASGIQAWLDIDGDGAASKFRWAGSANTPMFLSKGWKHSRITGISLNTADVAGVVGWDVDTDGTYTSTGFLTFVDCLVEFGTGGTCVGWRGGISTTGSGDVSFLEFHDCVVLGQDRSYGDTGWLALRGNALNWNWYGGTVFTCGKAFSNVRPGGGQHGGAAMFFHGFGTSTLATDFEFSTYGTYSIEGGRFENGQRFLSCTNGGYGSVVSIAGAAISGFAPTDDYLFYLGHSVQFSLERCWVENVNGSDYTVGMIFGRNLDPETGSISVRNCIIQAAEPFYTIYGTGGGTWSVRIEDCARNASADAVGRYATTLASCLTERAFTETTGAGTYTATVVIPAGSTVGNVTWRNTAVWTASTSASLTVGDDDDANGYIEATNLLTTPAADVNGAGAGISTRLTLGATVGVYKGGSGKFCAAAKTITATVVTVGASGSAGRSRLIVEYVRPFSSAAAKA